MKDTCIIDLDGTLSDCNHRLHHIKNKPKNWKAFNAGYRDDILIKPVFDILCSIQNKYRMVIMTGREASKDGMLHTLEWLNTNGIFITNVLKGYGFELRVEALLMRPQGSYEPDYVVKESLLNTLKENGHNPVIAFEDRPLVIDMFRRNGLYVFNCNQDTTNEE